MPLHLPDMPCLSHLSLFCTNESKWPLSLDWQWGVDTWVICLFAQDQIGHFAKTCHQKFGGGEFGGGDGELWFCNADAGKHCFLHDACCSWPCVVSWWGSLILVLGDVIWLCRGGSVFPLWRGRICDNPQSGWQCKKLRWQCNSLHPNYATIIHWLGFWLSEWCRGWYWVGVGHPWKWHSLISVGVSDCLFYCSSAFDVAAFADLIFANSLLTLVNASAVSISLEMVPLMALVSSCAPQMRNVSGKNCGFVICWCLKNTVSLTFIALVCTK